MAAPNGGGTDDEVYQLAGGQNVQIPPAADAPAAASAQTVSFATPRSLEQTMPAPHAAAPVANNESSTVLEMCTSSDWPTNGNGADSSPAAGGGSSPYGSMSTTRGVRLVVYDVSCRMGKKMTLQNVTGTVEPGEFYAIMGPSGAGKTMLMDIVSFRKSLGKVKGAVFYNGKLPTRRYMQQHVAYVEQQITLQGAFTVEEAILFSALLKRPRNLFTKESIHKTVEAHHRAIASGIVRHLELDLRTVRQ